MKKLLVCAILLLNACAIVGAQDTAQMPEAVNFDARYTGDFGRNISGGIAQENFYLGLMGITTTVSTDGLGWWEGGMLTIDLANTHGRSLSADLVGDMQVASNIDNGLSTVLYSAYYQQSIGTFDVFAGKHDLNSEFMVCENSMLFINSSSGVVPTASLNMPLSIFPRPAMGAGFIWSSGDHWGLRSAVYDGSAPEGDELNADLVPSMDAYTAIAEVDYRIEETKTHIKLGALLHTEETESLNGAEALPYNYTVYGNAERRLFAVRQTDIIACGHLSLAPSEYNHVDRFAALGTVANGIKGKYSIGMMYNYMGCSKHAGTEKRSEQTVELTASLPISDNFRIQPDIQYVVNPGASGASGNALLGMIRLIVEL